MSKKMGAAEWLMLLLLSLIWGASFIFNEVALEAFPPVSLVFLRVGTGALALTLILKMRGIHLPREPRIWRMFLVMAVLQNALPFSLIVWGQQYISAGLASILNGTTPFFTVLVAQAFTGDEKITPLKLMGLLAGFAGVIIIIGPETLGGLTDAGLGKFAILGSSLCYGLSLVWARRFSSLTPGVAPAGMLWCASIIMLPMIFIDGAPFSADPGLVEWGAILGLGVLCSAVAYLLFFILVSRAGATNTSLVTFIIPVSALLLAYVFLGEVLSLQVVPGVGLIFLGLALVDGRVFTRRVQKAL